MSGVLGEDLDTGSVKKISNAIHSRLNLVFKANGRNAKGVRVHGDIA